MSEAREGLCASPRYTRYTRGLCRCDGCRELYNDWRRKKYGHVPRAEYVAAIAAPHGTAARYRRRCRCSECRAAGTNDRRLRRQTASPPAVHNANGYKNGCRCNTCRAAIRDLRRAERQASKCLTL